MTILTKKDVAEIEKYDDGMRGFDIEDLIETLRARESGLFELAEVLKPLLEEVGIMALTEKGRKAYEHTSMLCDGVELIKEVT